MQKTRLTHAYLGRFSPFQRGHQAALNKLVQSFGEENCLVIIGSINTRNERTPYTYEQRKKMVNTLFPGVKVVGLPDGKPNQLYFDGSTNKQWLDSVEAIQKKMGTKFVFYGGSHEDLQVLSERFETRILVDRKNTPKVTATNVRVALNEGDREALAELLDLKLVDLAIAGYEEFINLEKHE